MGETAPNRSLEFLSSQPKGTNPFILQKIKQSIYLQLVVLLGIAVLIAAVVYASLMFVQNRSVKVQNNPEESRSSNQDSQLSQIELQSKQDKQRKNDIAAINSALQSFFLKEKKTPDSLKELVPDYLETLPTDPATQEEYTYKLSADKKSWSVAATISDGTIFEKKGP